MTTVRSFPRLQRIATPAPALLSLRAASRRHDTGSERVQALRETDLDIQSGEFVAIVGPSGSGKSTLLQLLGGLDRPTGGRYVVDGVDTGRLSDDELAALRGRDFGFVFQRYHLLAHLSALENVTMPAQYGAPLPRARARQRARDLLDSLGLTPHLRRRPAQLSGGQQQRVGIARALMNDARVVFADEPTGALDARSGQALLDQLKALHRAGRTIVLVTHDPGIAAQADRVIELRDGAIVADRRVAPSSPQADAAIPAAQISRPDLTAPSLRRYASLWAAASTGALSLLRRPLQTGLTLLGIVIGIAAVSLVTAFGDGTRDKVLADIRALGTDTVEIRPSFSDVGDRSGVRARLGLEDLAVLRALPFVTAVSPVIGGTGSLSFGRRTVEAQIEGVSAEYFAARSRHFVAGTGFDDAAVARAAPVAVIDEPTAAALFPASADPIGHVVRVGPMAAVVVGVVRPPAGLPPPPGTFSIQLPHTTLLTRLTGDRGFDALTVRVRPEVPMPEAERAIEHALRARPGAPSLTTQSLDTVLRAADRASRSLTWLVAGVAAVALGVAGVGLMNMMLVTVSERTAEIGVRMAAGARPRDIRAQFVLEAVAVCVAGGLGGLMLTGLAVGLLPWVLPDAALRLSAGSMAAAVGGAAATGLLFGYWPAARAAALTPVEALQR